MVNPLVAQPQSSTTAFTGAGLVESAAGLKDSIESGDWAASAMAAVDVGLSALGAVMDPFGAVLAAGVGWLMEHVGPLKEALDQLAGNPDEIAAHADTWQNVAAELGLVAGDLGAMVTADTAGWQGAAADAYRQRAADTATLLAAAQHGADGAASGVRTAGELVGAVRGLVRDTIAEFVGHLVSWALQALATLGVGLLWVVPQVGKAVADMAMDIARVTTRLVKALKALGPLLKRAGDLFDDAGRALRGISPGSATPPPTITRNTPPPVHHTNGPSGGSTTTSGTPTDTPPPPKFHDPGSPPGGGNTHTSGGPDGPPSGGTTHTSGGPPPGAGNTHTSGGPPPSGGNTHTSGGPPSSGGTPPRAGDTHTSGAPDGPPPRNDVPPPRTDSPPPRTDTPPRVDTPPGDGIRSRSTPPGAHDNPVNNRPTCGDPIDVSTGWMILPQTDVELDSTLPLVLTRTHLSHYRLGRSFGRSWASTVDQRLEVDANGVAFAAEDGTLLLYPPVAEGQEVLPERGPRWPLTRTRDGGHAILLTERDRILHFAAAPGGEQPITAISDANGRRVEFARDEHGVLVGVAHSGGYRVRVDTSDGLITGLWLVGPAPAVLLGEFRYDAARRLVEVVNSSGTPLRFTYDDRDRIVRCDDRNGMWYAYSYDESDRCVRAEGAGGYLDYAFEYLPGLTRATNSLGHTTVYELDEGFNVVRETDPLGNSKLSEWDEHHRLVARTDPLGRKTSYRYDERGNLVAVTYPDNTQSLGEYDGANRLLSIVDPDGAVWRREYGPAGALTAVVDPIGARTEYAYDVLGNLSAVTDATGGVTTYQVNALGLVTATTDPSGATTRYAYDELGRRSRITDPSGGETVLAWTPEGNPAGRVGPDGARTLVRRDGEGNPRESVDAGGAATRIDIGPFDLPVAEVRPDGTRLEFTYDTELRPVSVTNEHGQVWRYAYDPAGNLVSERDFDGRTVHYARDAAGQPVARTNAVGQTVRYTWDARGRVVARAQDGSVTRLAYDPVGRIVRATTPEADLVVTYDACGRVVGETVDGRTLASRYDVLGRRVSRRTPSGALSAWEYGATGLPTALHTAGRTVRFSHDAAGREVERRIGDRVLLAQVWDEADRLRSQTVVTGVGAAAPVLAQRRAYRYRPDGGLVAVDDVLAGGREFDLDAAGRVTAVRGAAGVETYGYDRAGNVVHAGSRAPDGNGPREYRGTLVTRAGNVRYDYDAEGRMVRREVTRPGGRSETWRFGWDGEDHLVWTRTPDGALWRYGYDALGRRVWKQRMSPDGRTVLERVDFTWDGAVLAEQVRNRSSALVWDRVPGVDRLIGQTERMLDGQQWVDRRFHGIVTDLVGAPAELVDPDGTVVWRQDMTLWGTSSAPAGTPLRFPGQYHDAETGLHYNVHRYYDPLVGRYASHDRLGLGPAPNPRAYVHNPTTFADPLGLMPVACQQPNASGHLAGDKTHAFTGYNQYQSGWTSPPGRFDSVAPDAVMNNSNVPFGTHNFDQGVPGQYKASHAELQAWHGGPGNPIVVSRPMCNSCQPQFQGLANAHGSNVYVGSPAGIHTFAPGGTHQTSLGPGPVQGIDANGNPWTMTHDPGQGSTSLVTYRPGHTDQNPSFTESIVNNDYSGSQYLHNVNNDGVSSYAAYYPNKASNILTEGPGQQTVGITQIGPAGGTKDDIGGVVTNVPPAQRW